MNEKELDILRLVKNGDFHGLEQLIDLFGTDILQTIQYILNHPAENSYIQDVQNKVFYQLWKELKHFDLTKSSLKTWIIVITRNKALDEKRKIIRQLKMIPTDSAELGDEKFEEHYFERENFLSLLTTLSAEDQIIFLKHYFYQDKVADIARDLQLTPEIVYNRLSRGRKKLRHDLQNLGGLTP